MHLTKLIWRGIRLRVSQRSNGSVLVPPLLEFSSLFDISNSFSVYETVTK